MNEKKERNTPLCFTVIVTGGELLAGIRQDAHIPYINSTLSKLGMECRKCHVLGDCDRSLSVVVKEALRETDLVIVTGGLGPTLDDITREALSDATGILMEESTEALNELKQRFQSIGRPMSDNNRQQALVPVRGTYLTNPNGTAPGLIYDLEDKAVVALPGPPRELIPMVTDQFVPFLRRRFNVKPAFISKRFRFCCCGESNIDNAIRENIAKIEGMRISSLAQVGTVDLTLSLPASNSQAENTLQECAETIKKRIGTYIYSEENDSLTDTVGKLLHNAGETLAVAESCTGGMLGQMITSSPGASSYFQGGIIAYNNTIKVNILSVEPKILNENGAVSKETANQLALGVRDKFKSTWGIGITGIAGPSGGTEEKPVGTVYISVAGEDKTAIPVRLKLFGNREAVRERSCIYALDQLRRLLLKIAIHS